MAWTALIPLAVAAVGAISQGIQGAQQKKEAKELQEKTVRPDYNIEQEYLRNQRLAQNAALQGLPADTRNYYEGQASSNLARSENAILDAGGDVNAIGDVYGNYLEDEQKIASTDAQLRTQNLQQLMAVNAQKAGEATTQWGLNELQPYKDDALAAARERAAGITNLNTAWGGLGSAASSYAMMKLYEDQLNPKTPASNTNVFQNFGKTYSQGATPTEQINNVYNPYNMTPEQAVSYFSQYNTTPLGVAQ